MGSENSKYGCFIRQPILPRRGSFHSRHKSMITIASPAQGPPLVPYVHNTLGGDSAVPDFQFVFHGVMSCHVPSVTSSRNEEVKTLAMRALNIPKRLIPLLIQASRASERKLLPAVSSLYHMTKVLK